MLQKRQRPASCPKLIIIYYYFRFSSSICFGRTKNRHKFCVAWFFREKSREILSRLTSTVCVQMCNNDINWPVAINVRASRHLNEEISSPAITASIRQIACVAMQACGHAFGGSIRHRYYYHQRLSESPKAMWFVQFHSADTLHFEIITTAMRQQQQHMQLNAALHMKMIIEAEILRDNGITIISRRRQQYVLQLVSAGAHKLWMSDRVCARRVSGMAECMAVWGPVHCNCRRQRLSHSKWRKWKKKRTFKMHHVESVLIKIKPKRMRECWMLISSLTRRPITTFTKTKEKWNEISYAKFV